MKCPDCKKEFSSNTQVRLHQKFHITPEPTVIAKIKKAVKKAIKKK